VVSALACVRGTYAMCHAMLLCSCTKTSTHNSQPHITLLPRVGQMLAARVVEDEHVMDKLPHMSKRQLP
jgi:hypothetical protein